MYLKKCYTLELFVYLLLFLFLLSLLLLLFLLLLKNVSIYFSNIYKDSDTLAAINYNITF